MVILMNKDKSLIITVPSVIYEKETNVDKIQFLCPQTYGDLALGNCSVVITYISPDTKLHRELLTKDEELYKDHLSYRLPVNTKLTAISGDVTLYLTFYHLADEGLDGKPNIYEQVMRTSETHFSVTPIKDLITWEADEALGAIDKRMLELEAKLKAADKEIEAIDSEKADNFYVENGKMYLSSDGEVINPDNPVNIGSHTWNDFSDETDTDGIIDDNDDKADDFTVVNDKLYLSSNGEIINPLNPIDIGSHRWEDFSSGD